MSHLRSVFGLSLLLATLAVAQDVRFDELPLGAAPGSTTPDLGIAHDTSLYVSWIEPTVDGLGHALRFATFQRDVDAWSEPRTIARGDNWLINGADTPTISVGLRGKVAVTWPVVGEPGGHAYHTVYATSEDAGRSWTTPAPISTESDTTEFAVLAPLINGRWLALWLDGRGHADDGPMQLRSRVLGSEEPDTLVDDRVCDCCNLAVTVLPNGAVLAAYRDRSENEVRDIVYQRYRRGTWTPAKSPGGDGWQINACPVNGPRLTRRGAHVGAAWFTMAGGTPTVMTARSNNIGNSWNLAGPVSDPEHPPVGRVDLVVTRDGSQWISWEERGGALALRQLDRDNVTGPIQRLPLVGQNRPGPHDRTRMVLLDNRADQAARLLIARPEGDRVRTYIATLPYDETATLDDCGCGPQEDTSRGHAVRGRIEQVLADRGALLVAHEEVPGVMKAMTMQFKVDPRVLPLVKPGQSVMARMERRADGQWWLFNLRLLKTAE